MNSTEIIEKLKSLADETTRHDMAKLGINTRTALGVPIKEVRAMVKELRKNHDVALELWESGIHEARIIATYMVDKDKCDETFLEKWVSEIDSWDLCDQFCANVACKAEIGKMKMYQWAVQDETFLKRAGFSMMANFAAKDLTLTDAELDSFSTLILNECDDGRIYVKNAVAWALKNIGKRDEENHKRAVKIAKVMKDTAGKTGKATATEVLSDINSEEVKKKLKGRK